MFSFLHSGPTRWRRSPQENQQRNEDGADRVGDVPLVPVDEHGGDDHADAAQGVRHDMQQNAVKDEVPAAAVLAGAVRVAVVVVVVLVRLVAVNEDT